MTMWRHFAAIGIAAVVAACGSGAGPSGPPPSPPPGGASVVAANLAFAPGSIQVASDVAFPLLFENRDGAPHNVTILDAGGAPVFVGETFGGPGSRVYDVSPLSSGEHRFRCDVHPDMTGTIVAALVAGG